MNTFIYYLGIILFLGGIIFPIVFLIKVYKKRTEFDSFKSFVKKYKVQFLLPCLIFILGLILLNISYYTSSNTKEYLTENNLTVSVQSNLLIYIFTVLFGISLFSTLYSLYACLYLLEFNLNKKYRRIWFSVSFIVLIISLILAFEGHSPYFEYPLANAIYIGKQGLKLINVYNYGSQFSDGLVIYLYAIFILSGACLVLYVCDYKLFRIYGKHDLITNTFLVGFPAGIIGARIWYVVLSISAGETTFTGSNWVNIFNFRDGGLGIMGGAVLGIIGGVSQVLIVKYAMKKEEYKVFSLLTAIDVIVPCILFAQAIGRWGNFFNNEVYGEAVSIAPWEWLPSLIKNNMYYHHGSILSITVDGVKYTGESALSYYQNNGVFYLPLFFIEFITNLCGYFFLEYGVRKLFKKYHSAGSLGGGYLIWYGATRAILEPLRTSADKYNTSIITSYVMIGGGLLIVALCTVNNFVLKKKHLWWYKEKETAIETNSTGENNND